MGYYTSYKDSNNVIYCDQSSVDCFMSVFSNSTARTICNTFNMVSTCGLSGPNSGSMLLLDPNQGWNCGLCANDIPFNRPVATDDVLHFQFQEIDNINGQNPAEPGIAGWQTGLCDVFAKDCCTNQYLEDPSAPGIPVSLVGLCPDYFIGVFNVPDYMGAAFYKNIQGIQIPMSAFYPLFKAAFPNSNCFYLEFQFNKGDLVTPNIISYYTNPYEFTNNCVNTIVLRSLYGSTDCNGHYYGDKIIAFPVVSSGNGFPFNNEIRIPAVVERTGFSISKEYVGVYPKVTSSQLQHNFQMNSYRLPEEIAIYLSNLLSGQSVYANYIEFLIDGEINKNNETGSQWFIEANMRQIDCSKTFSCEGTGNGGGTIGPGVGSTASMVINACTGYCSGISPASYECLGATSVTVYYNPAYPPTYQNIMSGNCAFYYDMNFTQPIAGYFAVVSGSIGSTTFYDIYEGIVGQQIPTYIGNTYDQCA